MSSIEKNSTTGLRKEKILFPLSFRYWRLYARCGLCGSSDGCNLGVSCQKPSELEPLLMRIYFRQVSYNEVSNCPYFLHSLSHANLAMDMPMVFKDDARPH